MTVFDKLTALADSFRNRYGGTDKLPIDDMTKLNSPNLLASFTGPYTEPEVSFGTNDLINRIIFFMFIKIQPVKIKN